MLNKKYFLEHLKNFYDDIVISLNNPYIKHYIAIICILLWILCTLTNAYMNCYNTDELWAWDIASDMNFIDIIKLMHYEGHTFLWYIILKPFTHINNFFPYAIKFVNWFFALLSIILLWRFAPFNNILKIVITFSHPFLIIYPTLGRGYTLSILLLFLLTIIYQKRFEKPILYSLILFLAINSDIMTFLCSSGFAIYFIYDYLKQEQNNNKLTKWIPILITILGWIFILLQWLPFYPPNYIDDINRIEYLERFFFSNKDNFINNCISFIIFFPFAQFVLFKVACCIKNKRFILLPIVLFNLMFAFFYLIYAGRNFHLYFSYIYLIIFYWIILKNSKEIFDNKFVYYLLLTFMICISLIFIPANRQDHYWSFDKSVFDLGADDIKTIVPKGSVIYMPIDLSQGLIPYLKDDYILKTLNGDKIPSYKAYKGIYQEQYKDIDEISAPEKNAYYVIAIQYTIQYAHRIKFYIPEQYSSNEDNIIYYIFKLDKKTIKSVRKMKSGEKDKKNENDHKKI